MMLALAKPTDGFVEILGQRMAPNAVRAFERIGSMLENAGAYGNLTVRENLEMQRNLLGLRRDRWVDEVVEMCDLGEYLDRRAGTLSLGNKQRLGLGRALLHKPEVAHPRRADERARSRRHRGHARRAQASRRRAGHHGVPLEPHPLRGAAARRRASASSTTGRLLEEIGYDELRQRNREYLELAVSDTKRAAWVLEEKCGVRDFAVREEGAVRVYREFERADEYNRALVEAGVGISSMHMSEENLEDHFVRLTGVEDATPMPASERRSRRRGWRR